LHPGVPAELRGTYAGLAEPAVLDHLQRLGVTTLSLMPVQHRADEQRLLRWA
jgi:glycogen operon protein